jgi:hypothetical protein
LREAQKLFDQAESYFGIEPRSATGINERSLTGVDMLLNDIKAGNIVDTSRWGSGRGRYVRSFMDSSFSPRTAFSPSSFSVFNEKAFEKAGRQMQEPVFNDQSQPSSRQGRSKEKGRDVFTGAFPASYFNLGAGPQEELLEGTGVLLKGTSLRGSQYALPFYREDFEVMASPSGLSLPKPSATGKVTLDVPRDIPQDVRITVPLVAGLDLFSYVPFGLPSSKFEAPSLGGSVRGGGKKRKLLRRYPVMQPKDVLKEFF